MKCDDLRENLAAYLDGEIEGAPRRAMDEHFAACPACAAERRAHAAAWRLLDLAVPLAAPAGLAGRIAARTRTEGGGAGGGGRLFRLRSPLVAAAAVLLAAGGAVVLLRDRSVSGNGNGGDAPSDQLLDDLPVLENLDLLEGEYAEVLERVDSGAEDLDVLEGG
jgi:anti-sigma factor RsiW